MEIGRKIAHCRKAAGLSQEELASELGISRQAVSRWETGDAIPETEKVIALSRIFSVSTDYLLLDEVNEKTPSDKDGLSAALDRFYIRLKKLWNMLKPVLKQMRFALVLGFSLALLGWLSVKFGYRFMSPVTELQDAFLSIGFMMRIAGTLILLPSCTVVVYDLIKKKK